VPACPKISVSDLGKPAGGKARVCVAADHSGAPRYKRLAMPGATPRITKHERDFRRRDRPDPGRSIHYSIPIHNRYMVAKGQPLCRLRSCRRSHAGLNKPNYRPLITQHYSRRRGDRRRCQVPLPGIAPRRASANLSSISPYLPPPLVVARGRCSSVRFRCDGVIVGWGVLMYWVIALLVDSRRSLLSGPWV